MPIRFELRSAITAVEMIASGRGVRVRAFLKRRYGGKQWRKMKGVALVRTESNEIFKAEIHWYEAHGIGKREFKIKARLD